MSFGGIFSEACPHRKSVSRASLVWLSRRCPETGRRAVLVHVMRLMDVSWRLSIARAAAFDASSITGRALLPTTLSPEMPKIATLSRETQPTQVASETDAIYVAEATGTCTDTTHKRLVIWIDSANTGSCKLRCCAAHTGLDGTTRRRSSCARTICRKGPRRAAAMNRFKLHRMNRVDLFYGHCASLTMN